uniref:Uncharacterized protein n=1 Tax=Acanthochromis polyacanthus TaxID=80966 RepID=A0A3Q1FP52_9TELE
MEERPDSPRAVKVEELSQCVILTYFKGDINSMVDAHFSRALGKACKSTAPAAKVKKIRKTIKLGKLIKSWDEGHFLVPLSVNYLKCVNRPVLGVNTVSLLRV